MNRFWPDQRLSWSKRKSLSLTIWRCLTSGFAGGNFESSNSESNWLYSSISKFRKPRRHKTPTSSSATCCADGLVAIVGEQGVNVCVADAGFERRAHDAVLIPVVVAEDVA